MLTNSDLACKLQEFDSSVDLTRSRLRDGGPEFVDYFRTYVHHFFFFAVLAAFLKS